LQSTYQLTRFESAVFTEQARSAEGIANDALTCVLFTLKQEEKMMPMGEREVIGILCISGGILL
jgi:hypothetical protein